VRKTRALAYDTKLKARTGDSVVLAVLFRPDQPSSKSAADAVARAFKPLENVRVQELPFKVVEQPYTSKGDLQAAIGAQGIDALYVVGGLEGELSSIKEISRKRQVLTIGAREQLVADGLSLGVFVVDGKNTITVNLAASREEGAAFTSDLLRLARVIK
jgi:hypothetical protein